MKYIFVDSGIWISAFFKRDKYHKQGKEFLVWLNSQESVKVISTDYIITEVMAYLRRKSNPSTSIKALDFILNHDKTENYFITKDIFNKSIEIFRKYGQLSLVDSTIAFFYIRLDCDYLLSYDGGFDSFQGIKRLETPIILNK